MDRPDNDLQDLIAQLDPVSKTLIAEVDLGLQAKDFLASDLGRHFVGCAQQEILDAQTELARVWPWRRNRIQMLQNRIWRAQFLLSWLRELLISGKSAENAIQTGDSDG